MNEKELLNLSKSKFVKFAPAPWDLKGQGIIFAYKIPKSWINDCAHIPDYLKKEFKGGLGFLMLVNYHESPVGPYRELLFIPGKFGKSRKHSIISIYVNTPASTQNGRANWGIPKSTADIEWKEENGKQVITVKKLDHIIFSCEVNSGVIPLPATTSFLPIELHQRWNGVHFFVEPTGSGWGKLAKLKIKDLDPEYFPDIRKFRPLFGMNINPITMHFPEPKFHE
ncbi:acetoacetate decarboxylase family protein [Algoriphagus hitonicola]|uniref:Acetoacetate decarboxylase (ADC) n=1 Tax=Algoriphagus hitonicola TaxID=435880 RepID=A0A1I2PX91_9BACT|nr:acetoacetate decarboxylase family protein [Algoriphagus hitonicola]SFG20240.1 Acetoacetate decarboxylase (ADC) [Algoriphagus hitonicola]